MRRVQIAKTSYLITSIMVVLIGCIFLIWPNTSLNVLSCIVGVVILLSGIVKLYGYFSNDLYHIAFQFDLALGILTSVFGIVILIFPEFFAEYLVILISIFVIIDALFTIQNAVEAKKFGIKKWWMLLIGGVIAAAIGAIALLKPLETNLFVMRLIGIALMMDGLQNIIVAILTVHHNKKR